MAPSLEETENWSKFKTSGNLEEFRNTIQKCQEKGIQISSQTLKHLSNPDMTIDTLKAVDIANLRVSHNFT